MDFSPYQVFDALKRQGFSDDTAYGLAFVKQGERLKPEELKTMYAQVGKPDAQLPSGKDGHRDGQMGPLLAFNAASTAANTGLEKVLPNNATDAGLKKIGKGAAKFILPGLAALPAQAAYTKLTKNNYYDRADPKEVYTEIGGDMLGGMAGQAVGSAVAGKLAGRAAGGFLGSLTGPLAPIAAPAGMFIGSTLGGYLAPKLFKPATKAVEKDKRARYQNPL